MSFLNKFKKDKLDTETKVKAEKKINEEKENQQPKVQPAKKNEGIKGKTASSYRFLVKPLVTEKAGNMSAEGKYVFEVNSFANKVEIKKAIRAVYNVNPVKINILNVSGKSVRYGRTQGKTKNWKKAVVTLKPGDKIEVYEGV
jgi:large subunit ribosomal protein L23